MFPQFFVAGIVAVLTVGCLLGAVALLGISRAGSYTASAWTPFVLAHANSQLFGWVGLFVIGFTLQSQGTTVAKEPRFLALARWSLWLMSTGIVLRFLAEPLVQADSGRWLWAGVASSSLQMASVAVFLWNIAANRYRSGDRPGWPEAFVASALIWFVAATLAEPWSFIGSHQADSLASRAFVATWFQPLREAQFLGFVSMVVFGVAGSKFPGCLGFARGPAALGWIGLALWWSALVLRTVGWHLYRGAEFAQGSDTALRLGALSLLLATSALAVALQVFEPVRESNPSQKFVRAAFGWLLVSGGLLVVEPLVLAMHGQPFTHAYSGAFRHAVTVGFVSQMILGVGYHVAGRYSSVPDRLLPALWPTWWLLNLGNGGRVGLELATDLTPAAFVPMGATGFIELVALSLWAAPMIRLMFGRRQARAVTC